MNTTVVEVGPATVRGPESAAPELVSAALEAVDDDLALVGERAVAAGELWTEVLRTAGAGADAVVLVCPSWWPGTRTDRLRAATRATSIEVITRAAALQGSRRETVVEIAAEVIAITRPGVRAIVLPNHGPEMADRVLAETARSRAVVIDAPPGVDAVALVEAIRNRLTASGIPVRIAEEDEAIAGGSRPGSPDEPGPAATPTGRPRGAVLTAAVVAAVAVSGGLALRGDPGEPPDATTLLVEGQVRVLVPAAWPVRRITSGPGSARVQVVSPQGDVALHLTQSVGPPDEGLQRTAAALRAALAGEPPGVFVDFNDADTVAGRAAATYRELRAEHHVRWVVVVDGGVRIALGCQSAPDRHWAVRDVCEQAVRSAHRRS